MSDPLADRASPTEHPPHRRTGEPGRAPATGDVGRPLLMDPAGARPTGFAPPTASPWAPGGSAPANRPGRPNAPSVLAGPTPVTPSASVPAGPASVDSGPSESSFGPVSRMVTVSVRTPTSRIDLVLPDRTSLAEVLESVLDVAPRSLREEALAHGGWILRTAAGRPLPGSTTLLDEGIGSGTSLFLAGADSTEPAIVYDDVADVVAEVVRADAAAWPAAAGRMFALGLAACFAVLALLAVLALGPPWTGPALALAAITVLTLAAAAVVARRSGDNGVALTTGLVSVGAGTAAVVVVAAGTAPLTAIGPLPWLLGALAAGVLAGTASLAIGSRRVPFGAIITGAGLLAVALVGGAAFDLDRLGTAALICGLAVCVMPVLPGLALRFAAFEPDPLPTTPPGSTAGRGAVDPRDARTRTRRAIKLLTAFLHGVTWPALAAAVLLALGDQPAGRILAAVVGLALLLRARLFPTIGQRLPLLLAGALCLIAVPAGLLLTTTSTSTLIAVGGAAAVAAVICAVIAARRTRRSPALARAAEIVDLLLTIVAIPLVAGVWGAFAFVRGLGG
jgi:type VII secretion integral membrane protein EccD